MSTVAGTFVTGSKARYAPFGTMTTAPATNPSISDRGFTGHRMNNSATNDLGLIYMNARYYLPEIGRFISADSIEPDPQNPQSYNRYSYTRNNPVNFTDPTGHRECEIICDGESQNWRTYQDSAWLEGWDVKQQAANAATAETVLVDVPQAIVGAFWEPADWVLALRDGFQWNDSFGMLPFVPATVGRYADEGVSALRAARPKAFDIVPYRPTNSAHDLVNHHGILDVWASANIPGYLSRKGDAPTIALTVEQHKATISEYWNWIRENAFGRGPNWAEVLPQQIQELSLRMFDAAGVPPSVQDTYFRVFNQYIYTGTWQR